jgi:tetratricopeptide (TPR) repeat protein
MYSYRRTAEFLVLAVGCLWLGSVVSAQQVKTSPATPSAVTSEKAISLAEQGRCKESIPALKRSMAAQSVAAETRKQAGVVGVRCALGLDDRDSALDFIHSLNKQFPSDPDVLFVIVHAYSDLSTRTAQDLGRTAPQSMAAHKLNAEALEMQGRWEPAQLEYEGMIQRDPNARGVHFLLGRLLLSRPDAPPDAVERARQELLKEVQIDPNNADAQYILGELARRDEKWDEAISRFSQAAKINPGFSEAYLGWGATLLTLKKYEEAISPLRTGERLAPGNPDMHHALATALERSGHKEEAQKEFAIHRSLTSAQPSGKPE